ncbi:MAG TPA: transposase [Chthoniobacterales bacterium]|jgi:REP element-mobilizing transposase RayT|nr:transposase [Chthoniobacterales bacterium]
MIAPGDEIGRKHPPHFTATDRFNTSTIIFLTVCTKNRKPILANDSSHELLKKAWRTRPAWLVGRYVIMPDHVHLFCAPARPDSLPLTDWVEFWKSHVARNWFARSQVPIWQRHFWDTQLRRGENYDGKWEYVLQNPVRAGLTRPDEDWTFQGELNVLDW